MVLMGKSWGTAAAAELACTSGRLAPGIKAIVFANVANREYLDCMHEGDVPFLYLTNKDDPARKTLSSYEEEWGSDSKFHTFIGEAGGHSITEEFKEPITEFLRTNYA